jgi:HAD superfamily hydrolase (TIGR01509 family)
MSIKALIFDFDGTILDTETPEFQSWQAVYATFGCELPLSQWINTIGRGQDQITFDPYAYLQAITEKIIDRDAVRAQRRAVFDELMAGEALRAGVREYIEAAGEAGLRLAIASSSGRTWIEEHLDRFDLLPYFDVVRCADDVARTKPDPELYRTAAAALGLSPSEVIAFEDSPNGALAAKAAGVFCIVVPNPMTRHLPFETPDLTMDSLRSLPLRQLVARIESHPKFNSAV